jgi:hypothetical protein
MTNAMTASRALNRISVACLDEVVALEPAARELGGDRGARLTRQAARRGVFVRDLAAGVLALGGVPKDRSSYGARVSAALRSVHQLAVGPHHGTHYVTCEHAAEKTAEACSRALDLELPADVRFGVERQFAEADFDRKELHWLSFGGDPGGAPGKGMPWSEGEQPEAASAQR